NSVHYINRTMLNYLYQNNVDNILNNNEELTNLSNKAINVFFENIANNNDIEFKSFSQVCEFIKKYSFDDKFIFLGTKELTINENTIRLEIHGRKYCPRNRDNDSYEF